MGLVQSLIQNSTQIGHTFSPFIFYVEPASNNMGAVVYNVLDFTAILAICLKTISHIDWVMGEKPAIVVLNTIITSIKATGNRCKLTFYYCAFCWKGGCSDKTSLPTNIHDFSHLYLDLILSFKPSSKTTSSKASKKQQ